MQQLVALSSYHNRIFCILKRRICATYGSMKRFNHYCLFFRFLHHFFNPECSIISNFLQLNLEALLQRHELSYMSDHAIEIQNITSNWQMAQWNFCNREKKKQPYWSFTRSSMSFLSRSAESMWTWFRSWTFCWTNPLISLKDIC